MSAPQVGISIVPYADSLERNRELVRVADEGGLALVGVQDHPYQRRVRVRGESFDRFSARPEAWDDYLWREDQFKAPRKVLRLGLEALGDEPPVRRARLEELDSMYAWWERRIPTLREEYLADRGRGSSNGAKRGGR